MHCYVGMCDMHVLLLVQHIELDTCTEAAVASLDDAMGHRLVRFLVGDICRYQVLWYPPCSSVEDLRLCLEGCAASVY